MSIHLSYFILSDSNIILANPFHLCAARVSKQVAARGPGDLCLLFGPGLLCLVLVNILFLPMWLFFVNRNSLFVHTAHFCIALLVPGHFILLFPSWFQQREVTTSLKNFYYENTILYSIYSYINLLEQLNKAV